MIIQEANVDKDLDEFGEAVVAEGTTDDGLGLGNVVATELAELSESHPTHTIVLTVLDILCCLDCRKRQN